MAGRTRFSGSGRKHARGSAPARTATPSPDGAPDSPLGDGDSLAGVRSIRTAAYALLSRRDYSITELRDKLLDRGYPDADIELVISELTASRALDDRRVAAAHVRVASALKGRGRLRIARELAARGLSGAVADDALAHLGRQDEAEAIRKILLRKKWPLTPSLADRRRMYQHLLRRGYPSDAIRKALGAGADTEDE